MKQMTSIWLYDYWNRIRDEQAAPRRTDIDPSRIGPILPKTFIAEYRDDNQYYFRIAGSRICDYYGKELQSRPLLEYWDSREDRYTVMNMFDSVRNRFCAGILQFEVMSSHNQKAQCEMLALPVLNEEGEVRRILGSISVHKSVPWLGQFPVNSQRLLSTNIIWPSNNLSGDFTRQNILKPHQGRVVCIKKRYFRVVEGGRQD